MAKGRSATDFVILGLLCSSPKSGYDLKADIERAIGHFWSESYGQLYPALKRLDDEGLVERTSAPVGGRPRNVYSITDAGREELRTWLSEAPNPGPVRDELLLKVFLGPYGDMAGLVGHVREALGGFERTAAVLDGSMAWLQANFADDEGLPFWLLCADRGRRVAKARAEWARHALEVLAKLEGDGRG